MTKTKNKYDYPVDKKKCTKITGTESPAHAETYNGGMYFHAIDFVCPVNTPFIAAASGEVVKVKADSDIGGKDEKFDELGNYIEIKHANGEYSIYEHIRKDGALVKVGDMVKNGQIIGYTGATGWLADLGPHLHFVVGKYGKTLEDFKSLEIIWLKNGETVLRKANTGDVDKIIELEKSYYDGYSISREVLEQWIKTGRYYVIDEGAITGSIYFEFLNSIRDLPWEHEPIDEKPTYVYISEIAVKTEDVLPKLFSKVLEAARQRRVKTILWLTGEKAKHDQIEQRFLKSNSFELKQHVKKWECSPGHFIADHSIWVLKLS